MSTAQDGSTGIRTASGRDSLGCSMSALGCHQELTGPGFGIYRKGHDGTAMQRVETASSDRGILVGVSLAAGHRRRIFDGRRSVAYDFATDSCYVRSFTDDYRADIETGFDFFLLEISQAALQRTFIEAGLPAAEGLSCTPGAADPVLAHLARALLPALAAPDGGCPLFVDQVACAIQTHLAARLHGGTPKPARGTGLSRAQLARAMELLVAGMDGNVLIGDIAAACDISRNYFIRAFREATGTTPHQWLLARRIERARGLLSHPQLSLADIAVICGFADQSHMTRTFTRLTGASPGVWRRRQ